MNSPARKNLYLLVVVLFEDSYLENVTLGLTSVGGAHVTVIDAVSGTENLSRAIPMFAEFVGMKGRKLCKVLISCVNDESPVENLLEGLKGGGVDFTGDDLGEIYAIPLSEAVLSEQDIDW